MSCSFYCIYNLLVGKVVTAKISGLAELDFIISDDDLTQNMDKNIIKHVNLI